GRCIDRRAARSCSFRRVRGTPCGTWDAASRGGCTDTVDDDGKNSRRDASNGAWAATRDASQARWAEEPDDWKGTAAMTIKRMDNVGIVVESLDTAIAFFTELGLELEGRLMIEGEW